MKVKKREREQERGRDSERGRERQTQYAEMYARESDPPDGYYSNLIHGLLSLSPSTNTLRSLPLSLSMSPSLPACFAAAAE